MLSQITGALFYCDKQTNLFALVVKGTTVVRYEFYKKQYSHNISYRLLMVHQLEESSLLPLIQIKLCILYLSDTPYFVTIPLLVVAQCWGELFLRMPLVWLQHRY